MNQRGGRRETSLNVQVRCLTLNVSTSCASCMWQDRVLRLQKAQEMQTKSRREAAHDIALHMMAKVTEEFSCG